MFGIEKYLIIANTFVCILLTASLAYFVHKLDHNQTENLSERFDKIVESQMVVLDTLRSVREEQKAISAAITLNRNSNQNETADIIAKFTELNTNINNMNNNITTMSNRVKRLPESACQILR